MANFTAAQAAALFNDIQSYAQQLGIFQGVDTHDPWNAPGNRLYCSINLGVARLLPTASGMISASGQVTLTVRVWSSALQKPLDDIDPEVLAAACSLLGALAGGFTLNESVRNIDIFALVAQPAWVDFEGKPFRVIEIAVPLVINDMFSEVA
jgi:hypothetical protein